jgi:hypothetical protein
MHHLRGVGTGSRTEVKGEEDRGALVIRSACADLEQGAPPGVSTPAVSPYTFSRNQRSGLKRG